VATCNDVKIVICEVIYPIQVEDIEKKTQKLLRFL